MSFKEIREAREKATIELLTEFFEIADEWVLTFDEQKKLIGNELAEQLLTLARKNSIALLDDSSIARLSMIIGVRNDLLALYTKHKYSSHIRSANKYFEGKSLLSVMLEEPNDGIAHVRAYLKGIILGGFS